LGGARGSYVGILSQCRPDVSRQLAGIDGARNAVDEIERMLGERLPQAS
jgi:hypothetical protein